MRAFFYHKFYENEFLSTTWINTKFCLYKKISIKEKKFLNLWLITEQRFLNVRRFSDVLLIEVSTEFLASLMALVDWYLYLMHRLLLPDMQGYYTEKKIGTLPNPQKRFRRWQKWSKCVQNLKNRIKKSTKPFKGSSRVPRGRTF